MSRLGPVFDRLRAGRTPGLVTYVTAGDPDLARSRDVLRALARGGADVIEIGVPFSDPIADGPEIQRASERALAAGANLGAALDLVASVRPEVDVPLVLFTYVNPVLRMGLAEFVGRAAAAGVDGVLMLDLPIEEAEPMRQALDAKGIDHIFLISPTTTDARLREAARLGRGFLYAISRLGVTGTRETIAATARPLVDRIRAATTLPIALGFGLSRPEHVTDVTSFADAAVVGSAIVRQIAAAARDGGDPADAVEQFVRWLKGR
ncbi:MAG: tryptophan synthase subunit alpha [Vicinamibacterales bacterium]